MLASSRDEWAHEARRLELQGKQEQAQAIRDTFLQVKAVPWAPWSEAMLRDLLPRALDRAQPSVKPRQTLLDYALWHGQQAWVEQLAKQAQFQAARSLAPGDKFGELPENDYLGDYRRQQEIAWRAVASLRQRHLQPYTARNFKDLLRQCDQYGVDHHSPTGATPLMLAARAGNLPLVLALLERGADPLAVDEFGHTPWWSALNRAMEDPGFARQSLAPLFEHIAPAVLDVQTDGRLVRLERHQGEYWVLSLMLAGFKTQNTRCVERSLAQYRYHQGFFAEALHRTLECLPEHLWKSQRRKRSYVNQVLARAEVHSPYQPARRLWVRTSNGHYMANPLMQLRYHAGSDAPLWRPVFELLNLPWVEAGTQASESYYLSLSECLRIATLRATAGTIRAPAATLEQGDFF